VGTAARVPAMAVSSRSSREIVASGVQAQARNMQTNKKVFLKKKKLFISNA
jgi:hypothetical protein